MRGTVVREKPLATWLLLCGIYTVSLVACVVSLLLIVRTRFYRTVVHKAVLTNVVVFGIMALSNLSQAAFIATQVLPRSQEQLEEDSETVFARAIVIKLLSAWSLRAGAAVNVVISFVYYWLCRTTVRLENMSFNAIRVVFAVCMAMSVVFSAAHYLAGVKDVQFVGPVCVFVLHNYPWPSIITTATTWSCLLLCGGLVALGRRAMTDFAKYDVMGKYFLLLTLSFLFSYSTLAALGLCTFTMRDFTREYPELTTFLLSFPNIQSVVDLAINYQFLFRHRLRRVRPCEAPIAVDAST